MKSAHLVNSCHTATRVCTPWAGGRRLGSPTNPVAQYTSRNPVRSFHASQQRSITYRKGGARPIEQPPSPWAREQAEYYRKLKIYSALILATGAAMVVTVKSDLFPVPPPGQAQSSSGTMRLDAPPIDLQVQSFDVETGTSNIPTIPRYISLPSQDVGAPSAALPAGTSPGTSANGEPGQEQYQLLGLGIRTVSFLGIEVYVVGLYVAIPDVAALQERLIRLVNPVATTLVPAEREKLSTILLDPEHNQEVWTEILKDSKIRTAIRIAPTRNTDFGHLRDALGRGIMNKAQEPKPTSTPDQEDDYFSSESFGQSLNAFKSFFGGGRGKISKGEALYFLRSKSGDLSAYYEQQRKTSSSSSPKSTQEKTTTTDLTPLGEVKDGRISSLFWMMYLGGKKVSSEGARKSVIDGCVELASRPIGTVETMVV